MRKAFGVVTVAALEVDDFDAALAHLKRKRVKIALGPLDFFLYRPILLWAGVRGLWGFLRGEKAWGKLTRNARTVEN